MTAEEQTLVFAGAAEFAAWLDEHRTQHEGIWLKIAKKASAFSTVTGMEAVRLDSATAGSAASASPSTRTSSSSATPGGAPAARGRR